MGVIVVDNGKPKGYRYAMDVVIFGERASIP